MYTPGSLATVTRRAHPFSCCVPPQSSPTPPAPPHTTIRLLLSLDIHLSFLRFSGKETTQDVFFTRFCLVSYAEDNYFERRPGGPPFLGEPYSVVGDTRLFIHSSGLLWGGFQLRTIMNYNEIGYLQGMNGNGMNRIEG